MVWLSSDAMESGVPKLKGPNVLPSSTLAPPSNSSFTISVRPFLDAAMSGVVEMTEPKGPIVYPLSTLAPHHAAGILKANNSIYQLHAAGCHMLLV